MASYYIHKRLKLHYWAKKKEEGETEVDFAIALNDQILGIEVKSGATGLLKSLYNFSDITNKNKLVRIHTGHLKTEELTYHEKDYTVYSVPVYLVPRLLELL